MSKDTIAAPRIYSVKEKAALASIFTFLFDEETKVCVNKLDILAELSRKYEILPRMLASERRLTLEEAINTLKKNTALCTYLTNELVALAQSDSNYTIGEFILLQSIRYHLSGKGLICSIPKRRFAIGNNVILYINIAKENSGKRMTPTNSSPELSEDLSSATNVVRSLRLRLVTAASIASSFGEESFTKRIIDNFCYYFGNYDPNYVCQIINRIKNLNPKILGEIFKNEHTNSNYTIEPGPYLAIKVSDNDLNNKDEDAYARLYSNFFLLPVDGINSIETSVNTFFDSYRGTINREYSPMDDNEISNMDITNVKENFDVYKSLVSYYLSRGEESSITIIPKYGLVIFNDLKDIDGNLRGVSLNSRIIEYLFVAWQTAYENELKKLTESGTHYGKEILNRLIEHRSYYDICYIRKGGAIYDDTKIMDFRKVVQAIDKCLAEVTKYTPNPLDYTTTGAGKQAFMLKYSAESYHIFNKNVKIFVAGDDSIYPLTLSKKQQKKNREYYKIGCKYVDKKVLKTILEKKKSIKEWSQDHKDDIFQEVKEIFNPSNSSRPNQ